MMTGSLNVTKFVVDATAKNQINVTEKLTIVSARAIHRYRANGSKVMRRTRGGESKRLL